MKKYIFGLLVLSLVVVGLAIYILALGVSTRQDSKTAKAESDISSKLNSYVSSKDKIPTDLAAVGSSDVPSTIKYTKLSDSEYKICVTYKAAKGYESPGDVTSLVTSSLFSSMANSSDSGTTSSYKPSAYYPAYTHKKGETCQTIKPYLSSSIYDYNYDFDSDSSSSSSSSSSSTFDDSDYCSPTGIYYKYYKDYCKDGKLDFSSSSTSTSVN